MVSVARQLALLSHVAVLLAAFGVLVVILQVPRAPLPTEAIEDLAEQVGNASNLPWPAASLEIVAVTGMLTDARLSELAAKLPQMLLPEVVDISWRHVAPAGQFFSPCVEATAADCLRHFEEMDEVPKEALERSFKLALVPSQRNSALILDSGTTGVAQWRVDEAAEALEDFLAALTKHLKGTWFKRLRFGTDVPLFEMAPSYVFSFFLVGDCGRRVAWQFLESVLGPYLVHLLSRLHLLFDFEIDSQVVQCSSLGGHGKASASGAVVVDSVDLQADLLRRAGEWPGDAVTKAVRWLPPLVRFVAFRPSAPVTVLDPEKQPRHAFAVQGWGIVALANHSAADTSQTKAVDSFPLEEAQRVASAWASSLRSWLMLSPDATIQTGASKDGPIKLDILVAKPRLQGIAGWEMLLVARAVHEMFLRRAAETLQNVVSLVQSLPDLVVRAEIGAMAQEATSSAHQGLTAAKAGNLSMALAASRRALTVALETSHDDTVVAEMFFSWEFKYAVYLPVALPIALPILVACYRELRKMLARRRGAKEAAAEEVM